MTIAVITQPSGLIFPSAEVETALRDGLLRALIADASLKGDSISDDPVVLSASPFEIDSLVAVALLCTVEPILGFELKDDVVRAGGYSSIDQAIQHLMPGIKKAWEKHKKGGK